MKVLLISGSRSDLGSLESVYQALLKHKVDTDFVTLPTDLSKVGETYGLVIVEGDRFEILRAVTEVFLQKVPIVHLGGGDLSEGSQDDSLRHAISKLSHLHYTTCTESAKRVIQMGDEAWRVKVVGEPSVDNIKLMPLKEAKKEAGIEHFAGSFGIIIWHPNTLIDNSQVLSEAIVVTGALSRFNYDFLIIGPNADAGNEQIRQHFDSWASVREVDTPTHYIENLPRGVYLTLLANCSVLIGNSSSGYFEAPSFGTPVVDIGDRQKGRIRSSNIIHCGINYNEIVTAIVTALNKERIEIPNPYQTGSASDQIAHDISRIKDPKKLLLKRFYSIKH
jgi:UDP-hydrolysing UDP-N-acetyl-D-glucosamine 2-epimerase